MGYVFLLGIVVCGIGCFLMGYMGLLVCWLSI